MKILEKFLKKLMEGFSGRIVASLNEIFEEILVGILDESLEESLEKLVEKSLKAS